MSPPVSRRLFLGGSAASALWRATKRASAAEASLLLLVCSAAPTGQEPVAASIRPDAYLPTLVVGERMLPGLGSLAQAALVSWGALDLLPSDRLADLLRGPAPVRIAAASGTYPAPNRASWAKLGQLVARQPLFRQVVADLGGGNAPAPGFVAEGIDAFRAGLGPEAARRLVVRRIGGPLRYG